MEFLQYLWSGVAAGSLYALFAIGFSLMIKTTGFLNFAYADFAAAGTAFALLLMTMYGQSFWTSVLLALVVSAIAGALMERFLLRSIREADHAAPIILTMGISLIVGSALALPIPFALPFPKIIEGPTVWLGGVATSRDSLAIMAIVIVILLLMYIFFNYTLMGIALRATSQDLPTAKLMGIPADVTFAVTFAVASALGTLSGVLTAPTLGLSASFMNDMLFKAFMAAVIGGMGSLPGAVVGGLVVGIVDNLVAGYLSTELRAVYVFVIFLVVLLVMPKGVLHPPKITRAGIAKALRGRKAVRA